MDNNQAIDRGDSWISWEVPEYEKNTKSKNWYIGAAIVGGLLLLFSFLTDNFLFAAIIVIAGFVLFLREKEEPPLLKVDLTDEGIIVGKNFYDYDEIKNFAIVYKPRQGVKNLYFEFKVAVKHRLSIPLDNINPLPIRENLLKYLAEDLERTDQPLSEALGKLFRL